MTAATMNLLSQARHTHGERTAVVDGDVRWTYRDLERASFAFAHQLSGLGVHPGSPVALMMSNSAELVASVHAAWLLGAGVIPLSKQFREAEIRRYLAGFDVRVVVVDDSAAALFERVARDVLPACRVLRRSELIADRTREAPPEGAVPVDPEAPAMHQFSSGTTGQSKKIARSHRNLREEAAFLANGLALTAEDRILAAVPLFHTYGFAACLLAPLYAGAAVFIVDEYRPEVLGLIQRERVTVVPGVPFIFGLAAEAPLADVDLSSVRLCTSAGSPLSRAIFDAFQSRYGIPIRQLYGATELGAVALNRADDAHSTWQTVGRPLDGVEVQIWDDDHAPLPPGTVGEIAVRGPAQARSYTATSEETNRASFVNGFFVTGDLGQLDSAGSLQIVGRKRAFIDTATHKVDPTEVEEALLSHPAVAEAVVVGVPGPYGSELVKAVVVPRAEVLGPELAAHCRRSLAEYKVPALFELTREIPRNALGKVLRKYLVTTPNGDGAVADHSSLDDVQLAAELFTLVKDALRVENVRAADRFYDIGGTSLVAIGLALSIEQRFGVQISLATVFSNCTISVLVDLVRDRVRQGRPSGRPSLQPEVLARNEERSEWSPLSYPQDAWWEWERQHDPNPMWNMSEAIRFHGSLDRAALASSLSEVVARHGALRTTFEERDGAVMQRILPATPVELQFEKVGTEGLWPEARLREEQEVLFDLRGGALLRAKLYGLGDDDHVLQLTAHHLVIDAASMGLVRTEIGALYAERTGGPAHSLRDPPMSLADYATWQRANFSPERSVAEIAYWRSVLDGADAIRFRGRPIHEGRHVPIRTGADLFLPREAIGAAASALDGATLFMVVTTTYLAVLSKLCENEELVVRIPFNHRPGPRLADVCGNFADVFFLRVVVGDDPSFMELLSRVRASILAALEQFVPAKLALGGEATGLTSVLSRVLLNLSPVAPHVRELGGLRSETRFIEARTIPATLATRFVEVVDGVNVRFGADRELFRQAEIQAIAQLFRSVLEDATSRPSVRLSAIAAPW
jgi:long-chain acyl-CoA synthetase